MAFAIEAKAKGDEDKVFTSLRRLQEEDPTIDLHRDQQTGEQIVAGLSQIHVEVVVDRLKSRFGVEVDAQAAARALPGDDPQAGQGARPPQEADRRPRPVRRLPHRDRAAAPTATGFEFVDKIKGGVIPHGLHPRGREGRARRDGATAPSPGFPVKGVRVTLVDGSYHTVDSSEHGVQDGGLDRDEGGDGQRRRRPARADHARDAVSVPEDCVGDVIGDLNSRRGRPQGMEPAPGGMTEVKAEVPMAEMLTYAPDLRSLTGGQGDYTMEFVRYEEVPAHLASKVVGGDRRRRPRSDSDPVRAGAVALALGSTA